MITLLALLALSPVEGLAQADYFPLEPGMSWTYRTHAGRDFVKRVVGVERVGEVDCALVLSGDVEKNWLSVAADGVRAHRSRGVVYERPLLLFKFPLTPGDAWSGEVGTKDGPARFDFKAVGEEAVEVPAGKFSAFRIDWTTGETRGRAWLAKGVGSVKEAFGSSELSLVRHARPGDAWLPLGKGAKWQYQVDYDETTDVVHEITAAEKVGEVECFVMEHRTEFNAGQPDARIRIMRKEWLARGEGGVMLHRTQRGPSEMRLEKPFFRLKEPPKAGAEWTGEAKVGEQQTTWKYTVDQEEDVEVPAGKYRAWKIRYEIQTGSSHRFEGIEWVAKDVGIVKAEAHIASSGDTFDFTTELKKFTPPAK